MLCWDSDGFIDIIGPYLNLCSTSFFKFLFCFSISGVGFSSLFLCGQGVGVLLKLIVGFGAHERGSIRWRFSEAMAFSWHKQKIIKKILQYQSH